MSVDRIFFDPCPLAIGKGLAYLLAFLTAVFFADAGKNVYYFGIIMYCCGCICDYIEVAAYRKDKCIVVRWISGIIAVVIGVIIISTLAFLSQFDKLSSTVLWLKVHQLWINLALAVFWTIPLGCGLLLIFVSIKNEKNAYRERIRCSLGYKIKP